MASILYIPILSKAIKKSLLQPYFRLSSAGFSTAYERAEGSNAVKEAREGSEGGGTSGLSFTPEETVKEEGLYEAKHQGLAMTNDPARDGPVKAADMSDTVGDTAKATTDGQWKAAQETTQKIKDDARKGPNRSNTSSDEKDPNIEDLRRRAGGYDKRDH